MCISKVALIDLRSVFLCYHPPLPLGRCAGRNKWCACLFPTAPRTSSPQARAPRHGLARGRGRTHGGASDILHRTNTRNSCRQGGGGRGNTTPANPLASRHAIASFLELQQNLISDARRIADRKARQRDVGGASSKARCTRRRGALCP